MSLEDEDAAHSKHGPKVKRLFLREDPLEEQFFKCIHPDREKRYTETKSCDFDFATFCSDNINNPAMRATLKPFIPRWTYGFSPRASVILIAGDDRTQVFFSSSHMGVLYNYKTGEMKFLEGHQGEIVSVAADGNLKYLLTADGAPAGENCLIIWDLIKCVPVLTFFDIYPKSGTLLSRMSRGAHYILTMGFDGEFFLLDYWIWSNGKDKPDSTFKFANCYGTPKKICINPGDENRLMVVFEKQVFFITIDNNELIQMAVPKVPAKIFHKTGFFTHGALVRESHKQFASTTKGFICIFANSLFHKPVYDKCETDKGKIFINAVKITNAMITCMRQSSGMLIVGTREGKIYFFDKRIQVMYTFTTPDKGDIFSVSFAFAPRSYRPIKVKKKPCRLQTTPYYYKLAGIRTRPEPEMYEIISGKCTDETADVEKVILNQYAIRTSYMLDQTPFVIKNFIVATSCCNIFHYDYFANKFTSLFDEFDGEVSAIETSNTSSHLVLGFRSGRVSIIDHETNRTINTVLLPKSNEEDKHFISSIKYSPNSFHLVCGRANGELWILDTILLKPKTPKPIKVGHSKIKKIRFSADSTQFAYIDDDQNIYLFVFNRETHRWTNKGKIRSHYKDIQDMLFHPDPKKSVLCTIGADRYITEYNNLNIGGGDFGIISRERVFQSCIPICFTSFTKIINDELVEYLLIADDQNKYLTVPLEPKTIRSVVLGPAYGCFKHQTVHKMIILENNPNIMIFMTKRHVGLQILPADGSPFKYIGYLVHPAKLHNFVTSADGKYVFTLGMFDKFVVKWEIMPKSVQILQQAGGKELEGFYCLLDGGKNGLMFQEMVDLFYYMQILEQGENYALPRSVLDTIPITELPDLMRACGFFPTEFEIENILVDIKYRDYDEHDKVRNNINFADFVKLFINHRPAYGYSIEDLRSSFKTLVQSADPSGDFIRRTDFIEFLSTTGEQVPVNHLKKCFQVLLSVRDTAKGLLLPNKIYFETLITDILGIVEEHSRYSANKLDIAMIESEENENGDKG